MKEKFKRLSIDFPTNEYVYLKIACAKKGVSIKDFVTESIIRSIEDYEDILAIEAAEKDIKEGNGIDWEEAKKMLNLE